MNSFIQALKRAFRQPAFLIAFIIMAVGALTLNTVAAKLKLSWIKAAVPLRVPSLKQGIPTKMGHWVMVDKDQAIDPEVEQVLATKEYVFRNYVDNTRISDAEIEILKNSPAQERESKLSELQRRHPEAILRVGITYYTGMVDTVAHVPERCYVADGFEVKAYEEQAVSLGTYADGAPRDLSFRFVQFEDAASLGLRVDRVARNVGYVFLCNGAYTASPYEVRARLQNLFEPFGYYAKVEMMTAAPMPPGEYHGILEANNHDSSVAAMKDFLTEALPEVEKCLPDWKALHQKSAH